MPLHRLDYGSVSISSLGPDVGFDSARMMECARCICGFELYGEGATFAEADQRLQRAFAQHLADVASEAPGSSSA